MATLNTVTSLTVNSIMDIFLQILQNFQNTAVFKTIFNCLTELGLILWYIGVRLEKYSLPYWIWTGFMTVFFFLDSDLKNTCTNLLDSDWFCYNQAGMLLEKYENLFKLSGKQLVIQSSLASSISLGQTMFGVLKTKC